jgi:hypothetical protein
MCSKKEKGNRATDKLFRMKKGMAADELNNIGEGGQRN